MIVVGPDGIGPSSARRKRAIATTKLRTRVIETYDLVIYEVPLDGV